MRVALLILGVLLLGLYVEVEDLGPKLESETWLRFDLPAIALLIYSVIAIVVLYRMVDLFPGVFALRRPLGPVDSGYGYLWGPLILAGLIQFTWTIPLEPAEGETARYLRFRYGYFNEGVAGDIAFGVFVLLMLLLKLRAAMREANRLLAAEE
jgi:hypothetical protein